jgi:proline utilization trans-activator
MVLITLSKAGVALRLAMSNGLSRDDATVQMKRSEKTHRNRLWWTIYMQERSFIHPGYVAFSDLS